MRTDAQTLFTEIQRVIHDEALLIEPGENVVLIEVSGERFDMLNLTFTAFGTFAILSRFPIQRTQTNQSRVVGDLVQFIKRVSRGKLEAALAFVMGEFALVSGVGELLINAFGLNDCFVVDLYPNADTTQMPNITDIRDYLQAQPGIAQHSLEIIACEIPNNLETMGHRRALNIVPLTIYDVGQKVFANETIAEVPLFAPYLNEPIDIFFQEKLPHERVPKQTIVHSVIPYDTEFFAIVYFDGQDWKVEWDGADPNPEEKPSVTSSSEIPPRPRVNVRLVAPKILFIIESALGMTRLLHQRKGSTTESNNEDTDFSVIRDFIIWMIDTLSLSQAEFALMFYNDYHPEQALPYEFRLLKNINTIDDPEQILTFLPDTTMDGQPIFTSAAQIIEQINEDFLDKQTVTVDWYKSIEYAANYINNIDWQGSDHLVIWIGQSSPHHHNSASQVPQYYIGFESPHNFIEELDKSWDQSNPSHTEHLAFFVGSDIPLESLKREARQYWKQIGRTTNTYEIRLALPEDAKQEEIYDILVERSRDLMKSQIITPYPGANSRLNLPFRFIAGNIRIQMLSDEDQAP